ncbi:MAG: ferrous iron transport protein A [Thaumarchaeota archaeon]|nr:ferrous iron transport protein A [Nitrososphaerota archaeon]
MRIPLTDLREGQEGVVVSIGSGGWTLGARGPPLDRPSGGGWIPFFGRRFRRRWRRGLGRGMAYGAEKRLADLGIVVGSRIRVVRKAPFGGPIEVEVAGSRFLIGRRLAERIIVEV